MLTEKFQRFIADFLPYFDKVILLFKCFNLFKNIRNKCSGKVGKQSSKIRTLCRDKQFEPTKITCEI